jgi:hypothetical protein
LEEIVAAPVKKTENTTGEFRSADHATPSIRKSWYYFAKKWRSLGRHGSLADQSHGVFFSVPVADFLFSTISLNTINFLSSLASALTKTALLTATVLSGSLRALV